MTARRTAVVLALALSASLLSACKEDKPPAPPVPSVLVLAAAGAAGSEGPSYSGEVRARHEADLAFRVGGKLVARLVDVGAQVRPGTVLARLDPADLQLNVAAVRAQVSAAESDLALAKADLDRYTALARDKFVSPAMLDAKTTAWQAAAARLDQARAQLAVSGNQAAYGTLASDRAGVVTAVLAEPGQVVAAGQAVVRVARPDEKEVLVYVPEGQLAAFKAANSLAVTLWARPDLRLRGRLRELAPAADPATRTYAARVSLPDAGADVQLGMTAQVALAEDAGVPGILVPLSAVIERGQGPEVWVVAQGKALRRPVKVAAYREDGVVLAAGVAVGEAVVAVGAHKLVAGQAVRPLPFKTEAR
ncbi:efflux RND transporter periplasmic adaptor subunit [Parasulfuritortus cantonensis]|uniref:efflux RND transporter periplasmic adaptor subunit n=1 Tax=Parasulfuritortus cantonensis TaxID=2528202 RepID=UPI001980EB0D|nr:efflux RND transporter periplasmic adaptor subunit [Parasulfuritortus cantonensis]